MLHKIHRHTLRLESTVLPKINPAGVFLQKHCIVERLRQEEHTTDKGITITELASIHTVLYSSLPRIGALPNPPYQTNLTPNHATTTTTTIDRSTFSPFTYYHLYRIDIARAVWIMASRQFSPILRALSRNSSTPFAARNFRTSSRLLETPTATLPLRKPVGAFRGGLVSVLLLAVMSEILGSGYVATLDYAGSFSALLLASSVVRSLLLILCGSWI